MTGKKLLRWFFCALPVISAAVAIPSGSLHAQVAAQQSVASQTALATDVSSFAAGQQSLDADLLKLDQANAAASVLQWRDIVRNWCQANAARIAAQTALGSKITGEVASFAPAYHPPPIPAGVSPDAKQLLTQSNTIDVALRQLSAQTEGMSPVARRDAVAVWCGQNAAALNAQQGLLVKVQREDPALPNPVPIVVSAPANASADVKAYIAARVAFENAVDAVYQASDGKSPTAVRDAVRAWYEQNQTSVKALQTLAAKTSQ